MTDVNTYVSANGYTCDRAKVTVGYVGPWTAELHLPNANVLNAPVTLRIGTLTLVGAPVPGMDGIYADQRTIRIAGGAAGWSSSIGRRGYHNDASVRAQLVAQDAAKEVGETLGGFVPVHERVGADYAREAGLASTALSRVIGEGAAWWVDYQGLTQVGQRPARTLVAGTYTVLSFNPSERTAVLIAPDPTTITVGATLADGIDRPSVIREMEITASGDEPMRFHVWLGGEGAQPGRLAALLTGIAERALDARLFGAYRYRVVTQGSDDRVDLQAVDLELGLPDLRFITLWPGVSGTRIRIGLGGQVLVMFAEGDRARPIVVSYAPSGADGFAPIGLVLGGSSGSPAARKGDSVALPPNVSFSGTIGTTAVNGTITAWGGDGTISSGSDVVSIAPEFLP